MYASALKTYQAKPVTIKKADSMSAFCVCTTLTVTWSTIKPLQRLHEGVGHHRPEPL